MTLLSHLLSTITNTDSYKVAHWSQYPEGTEYVSSYIEARKSNFAKQLGGRHDYVEFFGLQAYIRDYLSKPVTQDDIDLAEILFRLHGEPFNKEGWQYIVDAHGGRLPIEIRAVPEGTVLGTKNALVEIINTDPRCFWLTSYVETSMLRAVWYPTTVATKSRIIKEICREALEKTSDSADGVLDFMLHDFGARGASSTESSALAGMAHLVNFKGTDTVAGLVAALAHYSPEYADALEKNPGNPKRALIALLEKMEREGKPLTGVSVEASEHSTMTIQGRAGEFEQVRRLIAKAAEGRVVSIVSDSYDYFHNVMNVYGGRLKDDILAAGRKGGRVVIRPDSGDPVEVICKSLEILEDKFGCTVNSKGYKVLPSCVRLLQGDGIDLDTVHDLLRAIREKGYSVENVVFGMGGGLEQKVNRDDLGFAQKASAARINGQWVDVYKDPVTAQGDFSKKSKKGRLSTLWNGLAFATKRTAELSPGERDEMTPVFRDGMAIGFQPFEQVRSIAEYFSALMQKPEKDRAPVPTPWAERDRSRPSPFTPEA